MESSGKIKLPAVLYAVSVFLGTLMALIIYYLYSLGGLQPAGAQTLFLTSLVFALLLAYIVLWLGATCAFSAACVVTRPMAALISAGAALAATALIGIYMQPGALIIALLAALSFISPAAAITYAERTRKGLGTAVALSGSFAVAFWALAYIALVLSYGQGLSVQSITKPFDDLISMYIDSLKSIKAYAGTIFAVNAADIDAEIRNIEAIKPYLALSLPGTAGAFAAAAAFLSAFCASRAARRAGRGLSLEPIGSFKMDKIGAALYLISLALALFFVMFESGGEAGYIIVSNILSILSVPFTIAGFGTLSAIMSFFNAKRSTKIITIVVIVATSLFTPINVLSLITLLGVWDAFIDYRKKLGK